MDFLIFNNTSENELLEIYNDILKSKNEGIRPRSFDKYIDVIKEKCHMNVAQAWNMVQALFYEEIARRYFFNN